MHTLTTSPTAHNPHPFLSHLVQSDLPLWRSYVRHPFVAQLGEGTLPKESFVHYIKQDYHYLRHCQLLPANNGIADTQMLERTLSALTSQSSLQTCWLSPISPRTSPASPPTTSR